MAVHHQGLQSLQRAGIPCHDFHERALRIAALTAASTAAPTAALVTALLASGCGTVPVQHAPSDVLQFHVHVQGVQPGLGHVRCALYDDRATFLTREGIAEGKSEPAASDTVEFTFIVRSGKPLVVSVFQDANANERLDRGAFGIPSEPWGFSGKPSAFGPPTWDDCVVTPTAGGADCVTVKLRGQARPRRGTPDAAP